jgi:hypothetical protein
MSERAIPELRLEQYRLGELRGADAAEVREALATAEGLRERLAMLERSDAEILQAYPPAAFAAEVERRRLKTDDTRDRAGAPRARGLVPVVAAAMGVALVGGVVLWRGVPPGSDSGPSPMADRMKGGSPGLLLYRRAAERAVERLAPGTVARAHDVVQLAYQSGGRAYGVIVSIDGRGTLTRHLPATGGVAAPLQAGTVALPSAYRLDDAPLLERFYFVASDRPFAVAAVVAAARGASVDPLGADRLPLGPEFAQSSFLLMKDGPR